MTVLRYHQIRLAGPWEQSDGDASHRVTLPFRVEPADSVEESPIEVTRAFHRPSGLSHESSVVLAITFDGDAGAQLTSVRLNSQLVPVDDEQVNSTAARTIRGMMQAQPTHSLRQAEIGAALRGFNRLTLSLGRPALLVAVSLLIREDD